MPKWGVYDGCGLPCQDDDERWCGCSNEALSTVYAVEYVLCIMYYVLCIMLLLSFPSILTRQREAFQTELTPECRKTSLPIDRLCGLSC